MLKFKFDDEHNLMLVDDGGGSDTLITSLDLIHIHQRMDYKDREKLIRYLCANQAYEDCIAKAVIDRLANQGDACEDGWYSGSDDELRLSLLSKVEDTLLSGYQWSWMDWLRNWVKGVNQDRRIYWTLYHDCGDEGKRALAMIKNRLGYDLFDYERQEKELECLKNQIETCFKNLADGKEQGDESDDG